MVANALLSTEVSSPEEIEVGALQKPVAAQIHVYAKTEKKTCIECHKGIAHHLPKGG